MRNSWLLTMFLRLNLAVALLGCFCFAQGAADGASKTPKGPGKVIVHPALGGVIFEFDVDQNGTEGMLSEGVVSGDCPYATETFDQKTGKIIKVVRKGKSAGCGDDDVTWGIVGSSVGLVEHYHSPTFDDPELTFPVLNPLEGNQVTGDWLSPLKKKGEIEAVSSNQGTPVNAFQVYDFTTMLEYVYGSNVAKNEFGPVVQIGSDRGIIGLNTKTNRAVVTVGTSPFGIADINQIDLTTGKIESFPGVGSGQVLGIAVDSEDDMAVTTTFGDAGVEFYDLKNQTGFEVTLPFIPQNCDDACTGVDVEFDPIHKLFLVAQPISSQQQNSNFSTIYVYNRQGTLLETLNKFNFFSQRFDVFPVHMAIHPSDRSGFVDVTNSIGVGAIQSFTY
ncbi:MAG TPA: hypothetical protein VN950_02095 [Terriglobales bacterium]|nr:hypothetical protein [Terriglobales bacterium]